MRALGIAVEIQPFRQLDLRDQQEDRHVVSPRPVSSVDATARPPLLSRPSNTTKRLGAVAAIDEPQAQTATLLPRTGSDLATAPRRPAASVGIASQNPVFETDQRPGIMLH